MEDMKSMRTQKNISLTDIAKVAGLSVATVSKVLNNTQGSAVGEDKRNKILEIAGQLNYRPNRVAQFFENGKTGQIAYVIPHEILTNYSSRASFTLLMEQYAGMSEYFAKRNYMTTLAFAPAEDGPAFLRSAYLAQRCIDGIVLSSGEPELAMASEFEAMGISVVSFDWRSPRFKVSYVKESSDTGVEQAVMCLKQLGHKKAGCFFYYDDIRVHLAVMRSENFVQSCEDNGIEVMKNFRPTYRDETDSYAKTLELFSQGGEHPTVMFYPSDHSAMMGIRALQKLNFQVPGDVSVIGFDNAPYNIDSAVPLATINVPRKLKGGECAKLLLERIAHPDNKETKTISVHTEFIENESLGLAPGCSASVVG